MICDFSDLPVTETRRRLAKAEGVIWPGVAKRQKCNLLWQFMIFCYEQTHSSALAHVHLT